MPYAWGESQGQRPRKGGNSKNFHHLSPKGKLWLCHFLTLGPDLSEVQFPHLWHGHKDSSNPLYNLSFANDLIISEPQVAHL